MSNQLIRRLMCRTTHIQLLGNRIIVNSLKKNEFYSIPTADYEDFANHQDKLINKYISSIENLHRDLQKNKNDFDSVKLKPF